jgi:hypothetical protein
MSTSACPRAWQAAAAEDGRLAKRDLVSYERHLVACEVCTREVQALARLNRALEQLPVLTSTPLKQRRLRLSLLRRLNERVLDSPPVSRKGLAAVVAVAGVALAVGLVFWFRAFSPANVGAPTFRIAAFNGGLWRTLERGASLRLSARNGRFDVTVEKLKPDQRFQLRLPDGEIEVVGTRFIVDTDAVRTRSVHVIEGRVILRLDEAAALVALGAGETWKAETPDAPDGVTPRVLRGAGGAPPVDSSGPDTLPTPAPAVDAAGILRNRPERPAASGIGEAPAGASAGRDFASAMAAFSAGDYGRAEKLFRSFARRHPADTRTEDAGFLVAVSRFRRGDAKGAGEIAREYLQRYPNGLRRLEAEALTR